MKYLHTLCWSETKCVMPFQKLKGKEEEPLKYHAACDYHQRAEIQHL